MRVINFAIAALVLSSPVLAQGATEAPAPSQVATTGAADFSDAEVRRVDKDAQKITLRHGPIPNLDMGDMTMVFRVVEPRWLDELKDGNKIRFKADKIGGLYTITKVEVVN
jgi:Cu/Ag efflux protein CusF